MGTPYADCYEAFLGHIDDYELLYPYDDETVDEFDRRLNITLKRYFNKAIVKFTNPVTSLKRDNTIEEFDNDLRPIEIEIIGLLMLKEYYRKKLNFLGGLKGSFSDRDWKNHDKSNQMNQYRQMMKELDDEIYLMSVRNSQTDNIGNKNVDWLE